MIICYISFTIPNLNIYKQIRLPSRKAVSKQWLDCTKSAMVGLFLLLNPEQYPNGFNSYFCLQFYSFFFSFLQETFLRAISGSKQNYSIPHVPPVTHVPCHRLRRTSVNLPWHIPVAQRASFAGGFTSGDVCADECIVTVPTTVCASQLTPRPERPLLPCSPPQPCHHWSFYCHGSFAFRRVSCSWNHRVCALLIWVLPFSDPHLRFLHLYSWTCFFLVIEITISRPVSNLFFPPGYNRWIWAEASDLSHQRFGHSRGTWGWPRQ